MRRNTWILALIVLLAMGSGTWLVMRSLFFRETLIIFSLIERRYDHKPVADAIEEGIRLALDECGHRAGRFRVVEEQREMYFSFDMMEGVEKGAEDAIGNPQVVALIGTTNYHSSTIVTRLNVARLLMVTPDDRMPELTKPGYGYSNYTPECFRPTGELNFFRVIPPEDVVERGCAEWAWKGGARTVLILGDNSSQILGDGFLKSATRLGMTCVGDEALDSPIGNDAVTALILEKKPDVVYLRGERVYSWDAALIAAKRGGWKGRILLRGEHAEEFLKAQATVVPEEMVAISRAGPPPEFAKKFAARFGHPPDRSAHYGYLAAWTVVESIERARSKDRDEIRRACTRLPIFDANGDTVSNGLDVSTVQSGRLVFVETFVPAPPLPDPPKPVLTMSFQGTSQSQWWEGYGEMVNHEMRGTFYIDLEKVDTDGHLTWEDLRTLYQAGNEIGMTVGKEHNVLLFQQALDREKVGGSPSFWVPATQVPVSPELRKQLSGSGYRWGWGAPGEVLHAVPLAPGDYASVSGGGRTLEELKAVVDRALAERKHVDLRFQRIGNGDPGPDFTSGEDFRALCQYIHSKGFKVLPACQFYEGWSPVRGK
jgi:branched-chain amino acid transport system substrate-binding protein